MTSDRFRLPFTSIENGARTVSPDRSESAGTVVSGSDVRQTTVDRSWFSSTLRNTASRETVPFSSPRSLASYVNV